MKTLSVGVISENTTKPEDIIDSMLWELRYLGTDEAMEMHNRFKNDLDRSPDEHLSELLEELESEMVTFLPPYTQFGCMDGDGACYGVWIDHESLQMDIHDGDIKQLDDVDDDYVGTVINVTDHGNMSLLNYNKGATEELWAIV